MRTIIGFAVALALVLIGLAAAPVARRNAERVIWAVNGSAAEQLGPAQLDHQLAAMEAHGVRIVRADAPWADIEPLPPAPSGPVWQFSRTDSWVRGLARHRLTWEPIIDYEVGWAKPCPALPLLRFSAPRSCPPVNYAAYAAFARAVAARYGAHGSFWSLYPRLPYRPAQIFEIWNEEGGPPHYVPPMQYATLYTGAHSEIHNVDPTASVIVGGLGDDGSRFDANRDYPSLYVSKMFAADPALRGHVDGFGLHPYAPSAADVVQWVANFRRTLDSQGEARAPIDITEVGWPTGDPAREAWRAAMMRALASILPRSNCRIRLLSPYDWINPRAPAANDFGFVGATGLDTTLRPSGKAWFDGLRQATALPEVGLCGAVSTSRPAAVHRQAV